MEKIASDEEENVPLKKGKGNKKKKQGAKKKKQTSQVTFEELERMMEKIFEMAKRENTEGRY
jgi:hypothetical protein